MIKTVIALAVAAGFATASFAQGTAPTTPAAPAAKVTAPAPATAEKKVEAPKAAEPVKAEAAKAATPAKAETPKVEAVKSEGERSKTKVHGQKKAAEKTEHKADKPEVKTAPVTK